MAIAFNIIWQLVRKSIALLLFICCAVSLIAASVSVEIVGLIATERPTWHIGMLRVGLADAWRFFVYNPKN